MKKVLLVMSLPVLATGLALCLSNNVKPAFAEPEPVSIESEPAPESEPVPGSEAEPEPEISSEQESAPEISSEEEKSDEMTEEEKTALEEVKGWLGQYVDKQLVANIITWCSEAGVLAGLLGVYIKYRKFKGKTIEDLVKLIKEEVGKYLKESFEEMSADKIAKIVNAVDEVEKAQETVMKVLVLMQDSTKEGKIALLDFLGSKTKNEDVKQIAQEVSKELEAEKAKLDKAKKLVEGEYKDIF